MIHTNSIIAYWDGRHKFNKRECEILGWMLMHPAPVTDRNIKDALRYSDMNQIRPRITELIKKGCVEERDTVRCKVTGKTVRLVKVRVREMSPQMEMI